MANFVGKYKQVSSENFDNFFIELGVTSDQAKSMANQLQELEITKNGNIFTIKTTSPDRTHEYSFELGKEFDDKRGNGPSFKSLVVLDGDKLVQTTKANQEIEFVRELDGNNLKLTGTVGSVTAHRVYNRL